jgi:hypothetical protein
VHGEKVELAWRAHAQTEGGPNFHLTPVSEPKTMLDETAMSPAEKRAKEL